MTSDENKRETARSFGRAADAYLDSRVHATGADLDRLATWCADATMVLDVATGAGHTAGAVLERDVETVVAVDAAPEMVETAVDAFEGVEGVVGDAERLPFGPNYFDAVCCRIAAHHFPDPEAFVAAVARVLRPGGTLAFEDTVAPTDPDLAAFFDRVERLRDPTHVESYPTAQWREWLTNAGFAVEAVEHLQKTLDFEEWTGAQSLSPAERDRLEREFLGAPGGATSVFDIRVRDGSVESFDSPKVLIRARLVG